MLKRLLFLIMLSITLFVLANTVAHAQSLPTVIDAQCLYFQDSLMDPLLYQ